MASNSKFNTSPRAFPRASLRTSVKNRTTRISSENETATIPERRARLSQFFEDDRKKFSISSRLRNRASESVQLNVNIEESETKPFLKNKTTFELPITKQPEDCPPKISQNDSRKFRLNRRHTVNATLKQEDNQQEPQASSPQRSEPEPEGSIADLVKIRKDRALHKNSKVSQSPFTCEHCQKGFLHMTALKLHLRTHTGEKVFSCNHCDKEFLYNSTLKIHLSGCKTILRHPRKSNRCPDCSKLFLTKKELEVHIRKIHTDDNDKPYECSNSPKAFNQQNHQQQHLIRNSNKKLKEGNKSNRQTSPLDQPQPAAAALTENPAKDKLVKVKKKRRADDPYVTNVAPTSIKSQHRSLRPPQSPTKKAKASKKEESPIEIETPAHIEPSVIYLCDHCPKFFTSRKRLAKHNSLHALDDRKHDEGANQPEDSPTNFKDNQRSECEQSLKICATARRLKVHLRNQNNHAGERKPYTCPNCPKRFTYITSQTKHMSIHENNEKSIPEVIEIDPAPSESKQLGTNTAQSQQQTCFPEWHSLNEDEDLTSHENGNSLEVEILLDTRDESKVTPKKEKPYSCPHCPRKFTYITSQMKHLSTHETSSKLTEIPPIPPGSKELTTKTAQSQLSHQQACFPEWHSLNEDLTSHENENSLQEQVLLDTTAESKVTPPEKEKPYSCPHCPRKFTYITSQMKHLFTHDIQGESSPKLIEIPVPVPSGSKDHVSNTAQHQQQTRSPEKQLFNEETSQENEKRGKEILQDTIDNLDESNVASVKSPTTPKRLRKQTLKCRFLGKVKTKYQQQHKYQYCEKSFSTTHSMDEHHVNEQKEVSTNNFIRVKKNNAHPCLLCPRTFVNKVGLLSHTRHAHNSKNKAGLFGRRKQLSPTMPTNNFELTKDDKLLNVPTLPIGGKPADLAFDNKLPEMDPIQLKIGEGYESTDTDHIAPGSSQNSENPSELENDTNLQQHPQSSEKETLGEDAEGNEQLHCSSSDVILARGENASEASVEINIPLQNTVDTFCNGTPEPGIQTQSGQTQGDDDDPDGAIQNNSQDELKSLKNLALDVENHIQNPIQNDASLAQIDPSLIGSNENAVNMESDNKDTTFKCKLCSKQCLNDRGLMIHMYMTHRERKQQKRGRPKKGSTSGVHKFSCDICKKTFTGFVNLEIHQRLHTGERPFACTFCSARYTRSDCLKKHTTAHHSTETEAKQLRSQNKSEEPELPSRRSQNRAKLSSSVATQTQDMPNVSNSPNRNRNRTGQIPLETAQQDLDESEFISDDDDEIDDGESMYGIDSESNFDEGKGKLLLGMPGIPQGLEVFLVPPKILSKRELRKRSLSKQWKSFLKVYMGSS